MQNNHTPNQCRRNLFRQSGKSKTRECFVSPSLLGAVEHSNATERYGPFLTNQSYAIGKDGDRRVVNAVERIKTLRSQLGCVGMRDGVCCLVDYIELIPAEVEVQVVRGLADIDESEEELPAGPLIIAAVDVDFVEETIELRTA